MINNKIGPGIGATGGESCLRGFEFESRDLIKGGKKLHVNCCKSCSVQMFERPKINKKRPGKHVLLTNIGQF